MQLMPFTAKEIARRQKIRFKKEKITVFSTNLDIGNVFLRWTINRFDGNPYLCTSCLQWRSR